MDSREDVLRRTIDDCACKVVTSTSTLSIGRQSLVLVMRGPSVGHRSFNPATRRVALAATALKETLRLDDDDALHAGLRMLVARKPELKTPTQLTAHAAKEVKKAAFALPSQPSPARHAALARHGFNHSSLAVEVLRSSVQAADEKLIRNSFRAAVKAKKSDASVVLDVLAVELIKKGI